MADAVEMGMSSHVSLFGYLWVSKKQNKKQFKLRKNFNNSDLGALDFIVDKIHR